MKLAMKLDGVMRLRIVAAGALTISSAFLVFASGFLSADVRPEMRSRIASLERCDRGAMLPLDRPDNWEAALDRLEIAALGLKKDRASERSSDAVQRDLATERAEAAKDAHHIAQMNPWLYRPFIVEGPDGRVFRFPSTMPSEAIGAALQAEYPPAGTRDNKAPWTSDPIIDRGADGTAFTFPGSVPVADIDRQIDRYDRFSQTPAPSSPPNCSDWPNQVEALQADIKTAGQARTRRQTMAPMLILGPALLFWALGSLVGWIARGFRTSQ